MHLLPLFDTPSTETLLVFALILLPFAYYACYYFFYTDAGKAKRKKLSFIREEHNPVLEGRPHLDWECEGVFNPAAVRIDGRTHILYRAVGSDGISRVGYASSKDGTHIDEILPYPVFSSLIDRFIPLHLRKYSPVIYPSGGSWGGCEDPRITKIDNMLYLTYNAFDGWDFIRIGMTMIEEKDFVNKKWKWKKPQLISPPGEIHKNWMLFPEKLHGKFAILHSISPKVDIEYRDTLEDIGTKQPFIKSPVGVRTGGRNGSWDTRMRGAGAPPLRTNDGWLVFYHANDAHESHKYKVGVLLLDLKQPEKIIARADFPVLEPDAWYENDGKPGIVYVCGAVLQGDVVFLYYGGGDKRVCVAHLPVDELISWLTEEKVTPIISK